MKKKNWLNTDGVAEYDRPLLMKKNWKVVGFDAPEYNFNWSGTEFETVVPNLIPQN